MYCSYPSVCNRVFNSVLHSGTYLAPAPPPAPCTCTCTLIMNGRGSYYSLPCINHQGRGSGYSLPHMNYIFIIFFFTDRQRCRVVFVFWGHFKQIQLPSHNSGTCFFLKLGCQHAR